MRRTSLIATALAVVLVLGLPAGALAQSASTTPFSPFNPLPPTPPPTTPTATPTLPTTTTSSGGSLSGGSVVAIAVGAVVLLAGISLFIWRDARRRAPVRRRTKLATSPDGSAARARQRAKPRKLSPAERRRRKRGRAR